MRHFLRCAGLPAGRPTLRAEAAFLIGNSHMDQHSSFLDALGRELGIEIEPSPAGSAQFVVDGHGILIQWAEARRAFVVYAEVGRLAGWRDGEVVKTLMAANFLLLGADGGTLSLDPSTGMVGLNYQIPVCGLTSEAFVRAIDGIVVEADEWRGTLARMCAEQEKIAAEHQSAALDESAADAAHGYEMPAAMTMLRV